MVFPWQPREDPPLCAVILVDYLVLEDAPNGPIGMGQRLASLKVQCQSRVAGLTVFPGRSRRAWWPGGRAAVLIATLVPVPVPGWLGGKEGLRRAAPVRLRTWLQAAVSALLRVAAQGVWVTVLGWFRAMATASRWVSREPAENA